MNSQRQVGSAQLARATRQHLNKIILEFRSEPSAHMTTIATMLARVMATLDREEQALAREGPIGRGQRGEPILNPRARYVEQLITRMLRLRRTLGIHSAGHSDRRRLGRTREINKQNEGQPLSGLITRPTLVK